MTADVGIRTVALGAALSRREICRLMVLRVVHFVYKFVIRYH